MAKSKSKKSRRDRRIETEKRQTSSGEEASAFSSVPQTTMDGVSVSKSNADTKTINLGTEYYYVYTEVRNILAISLVMFGILFGLGMFI
ncbi:hypothetical protein QUF63_15465 [Anaerolineales bacterium HSG25]|nr:hypothetical protein [Anaerolineales bacterium HSG25]